MLLDVVTGRRGPTGASVQPAAKVVPGVELARARKATVWEIPSSRKAVSPGTAPVYTQLLT